jgi:hypothetical protein
MRPETIDLEVPRVKGAEGKLEVTDRFVEKALQFAGVVSGKWVVMGTLDGAVLDSLSTAEYGTLQFVAATKKVVRTAGSWAAAGLANYSRAGTKVTILGSSLNDGTYTVVSASATELVVAESLSNEAASAVERVEGYFANWAQVGAEVSGDGIVSIAPTLKHLCLVCSDAVGALDPSPVVTFAGLDARSS